MGRFNFTLFYSNGCGGKGLSKKRAGSFVCFCYGHGSIATWEKVWEGLFL